MTGIPIHPLRLAALDRMKVLRVPFKVQPKKEAAIIDRELMDTKGVYQTWLRNPDGGIDQDFNAQYFRPPYAPGERYVKEVTWEPTAIIVADVYYDADLTSERREAVRSLLYKRISAGRMNKEYARYIVTLGPPVPCRLGEVDVVQQRDEGVIIEIGDEYRRTWDALYPKHPFSPDRWTWGYPMEVRRR